MGLDMYVYRIKPVDLDPNLLYKYEELSMLGYSLYPDEYIDSPALRDIKKIAKPYNVEAEYYDMKAMQEYFNSKEMPYWCGISQNHNIFSVDGGLVYLNSEEIKPFLLLTTNVFWVVNKTEVAYWRAREDIQSAVYRYIGKRIDNEGYYKITPKVINVISKMHLPGFNLGYEYDKDNLFYHEWY